MLGPAVFWFGVAKKVVYKRFSKYPGPCIVRTWMKHTLVHCTSGIKILAGVEGVEPANAGIKIRCLNQLGDTPTQDSCLMLLLQVSYMQPTYQPFLLPANKRIGLQVTASADFKAIWMA